MEVHKYSSIKATVATDIVKDNNDNTKAKVKRKSARDIKNLRILPENSVNLLTRRKRNSLLIVCEDYCKTISFV